MTNREQLKKLLIQGFEEIYTRFTYLWKQSGIYVYDNEYSFQGKLFEFKNHFQEYFNNDFINECCMTIIDIYNKKEIQIEEFNNENIWININNIEIIIDFINEEF